VIGTTEYLGARAGSTVPLRLTTIPATLPIEFRTANIERMRLNPTVNYTIGSFATQNANGYLGLSPNATLWTAPSPGPFSRLHLHDGLTSVLDASYRPWMDNGITFTTNMDQMYIGHKVEPGDDQTAAVIQWSDNEFPAAGPDVLKFIFTSPYTGAGSGPTSLNGREIARMNPSGWFGVGDWQAVGLQPDERIDLLSRTIRLRDFTHATLYRNDTYGRVLVANPADGRVYWRDVSTIGGGCASGWNLIGNNPVTAYAGNPCPPQAANLLGVGTNAPTAKLHVVRTVAVGGQNIGILSSLNVGTATTVALDGLANSTGATSNVGVRGIATGGGNTFAASLTASGATTLNSGAQITSTGGQTAHGIHAQVTTGTVENRGYNTIVTGTGTSVNTGFRGQVSGGSQNFGVWTTVPAGAPHWAAFFEGRAHCTSGAWTSSDERLKTNIADLTNATAKILAIDPKTYRFNTAEYGFMGLDDSPQIGLLAQNVEAVLPELVAEVLRPAEYDSVGEMVRPEVRYKAVRYEGLVPVLVSAMKEQHQQAEDLRTTNAQLSGELSELRARLDRMEEKLADCCTKSGDDGMRKAPVEGPQDAPRLGNDMLRVQPNPFNEGTTLLYDLPRGGRIQLMANSADGKQLRVLEEAVREQGSYQYEWNTASLSAGVYYVTLLVDGEPLVKRVVKLDR